RRTSSPRPAGPPASGVFAGCDQTRGRDAGRPCRNCYAHETTLSGTPVLGSVLVGFRSVSSGRRLVLRGPLVVEQLGAQPAHQRDQLIVFPGRPAVKQVGRPP